MTTADFCQGGFYSATEHGAAVTEVVHEMAPAAQLYLACTDDEPSVVEAEQWAKKNGAQIINFSVGYFLSGRGDGSGLVGSAVADARAAGILWVNAAGNHAQEHWSGNWTDANGNDFLDFAPGDETNSFVLPNGAGVCGDLKWDEWPTAKSDFDLGLYSSTTNSFVVSSTTTQNGTQPPIEGVCYGNTTGAPMTVGWAIFGANVVSAPRFDLFSVGSAIPLQYQTAAGSIVDPATSPGALAVGALCWQNNSLEFYSSQGPTIDGRTKPDMSAQDSMSSVTYGAFDGSCPSGFAGTSSASPTTAGAAALVKQANPSFKAPQLQAFLEQRAVVDIGAAGVDDQTGAGALRLPNLSLSLDRTKPTAAGPVQQGRPRPQREAVLAAVRQLRPAQDPRTGQAERARDQDLHHGLLVHTQDGDRLHHLEGPVEDQGHDHALRARPGPSGQPEPEQLRERRAQRLMRLIFVPGNRRRPAWAGDRRVFVPGRFSELRVAGGMKARRVAAGADMEPFGPSRRHPPIG